jgi:hypothetical protein
MLNILALFLYFINNEGFIIVKKKIKIHFSFLNHEFIKFTGVEILQKWGYLHICYYV